MQIRVVDRGNQVSWFLYTNANTSKFRSVGMSSISDFTFPSNSLLQGSSQSSSQTCGLFLEPQAPPPPARSTLFLPHAETPVDISKLSLPELLQNPNVASLFEKLQNTKDELITAMQHNSQLSMENNRLLQENGRFQRQIIEVDSKREYEELSLAHVPYVANFY